MTNYQKRKEKNDEYRSKIMRFMAEILKMLEPKLEVKTEDGYEGILSLDHTTIQVEAAGYSTSSRTVTAERTYPNLSDADVSLIPKTVNENGRIFGTKPETNGWLTPKPPRWSSASLP